MVAKQPTEQGSKDDCVGRHMKEIQSAHPDWAREQMTAVALQKCGESNKTMNYDALRAAYEILTGEPVKPLKSAFTLDDTTNDDVLIPEALTPAEKSIYERTYKRVYLDTKDELKSRLAGLGAVNRARYGLAVKTRKDASGTYVSGWAIMFGNPEVLDLDETFFGKGTEFYLDYYEKSPCFWEHGMDANVRSDAIGHRVKTEVHDFGIWVTHQLHEDYPLFDQIAQKIEQGELAYSSDSMSHHVAQGYKSETGELSVWPLCGISLVSAPAEIGLSGVILEKKGKQE